MSWIRNPWVLIGLVTVILVGGAIWYGNTMSALYNEGVVIKPQIKGNPDAVVKLIEYSDFQCPACAQFQPVISELVEAYGDRLSFEYRHFPLMQTHRLAEPAARAAEAAGQQGKFFEFHDLLFQNQGTWANSTNPAHFFLEYATTLVLDIEQFTRQQRSSLIRAHVQAEFNEARAHGFSGTPSFLLNGKPMLFKTFDEFRAQVINAIDPTINLTAPTAPTGTNESAVNPISEPVAAPVENVRFGL